MQKRRSTKNLTILFVPDDNTGVFSFKINKLLFIFLCFLWLGATAFAGYILYRHVNYRATFEYNKFLTKKHKEFAKEILELRETVKRTAEVENQLRDLLKLKSKNAIIKYTGFGGPSYIDTQLLEKEIQKNDDVISRKAFEAAVKYIDYQAQTNEKSFQEIIKYITDQRAKLTAVPSGWPVKGWITCGFGSRIDPFTGALSFHQGVDIANDTGSPIKATADGVVQYADFERGGYGNLITINHGNGYLTRYGHLQKFIVSPGQHVKKNQIIGFLGSTGKSTSPHVHYEVILNGVAVNPVKYLNKEVALK
jgi:murein DD-endopeptidase MepM/ murein hydrolase activator NlpD